MEASLEITGWQRLGFAETAIYTMCYIEAQQEELLVLFPAYWNAIVFML